MPTVTVVPSDSLIIVDGGALVLPFDAPTNLHALQWRGTLAIPSGRMAPTSH